YSVELVSEYDRGKLEKHSLELDSLLTRQGQVKTIKPFIAQSSRTPDLRYFVKAESFWWMPPTQVRTIIEYGVGIAVILGRTFSLYAIGEGHHLLEHQYDVVDHAGPLFPRHFIKADLLVLEKCHTNDTWTMVLRNCTGSRSAQEEYEQRYWLSSPAISSSGYKVRKQLSEDIGLEKFILNVAIKYNLPTQAFKEYGFHVLKDLANEFLILEQR
ncbi:hypothetical protein TNCV_3583611, partial [Trichonephila clavipes]